MPNISTMKTSNYLGKGDVEASPLLGNMLNCTQENVAKKGDPEELKWCLHFSNIEKPLVLNQINMQLISQATGSPETDDWAGKQIVIFYDPNVSFGGKLTGGLRCRAPKVKKPAVVAPAPVPIPTPAPVAATSQIEDDDVPF